MKKLRHLSLLGIVLVAGSFVQTAIAQVTLNFKVNMTLQIAKGKFNPATDFVDVVGFDGTWDERPNKATNPNVMTDPDNDGIYTKTVTAPTPGNDTLKYKYRINGVWAGSDYSSKYKDKDGNRILETEGDGTYDSPMDFYLDEEGTLKSITVKFSVDMRNKIIAGDFDPATDFVDVTCFDGNCDANTNPSTNPNVMTDADNDSIYTTTKTFNVIIPTSGTYKMKYTFRINGDWNDRDTTLTPGVNDRFLTITKDQTTYETVVIYQGKQLVGIKENSLAITIGLKQNPVADVLTVMNQDVFNYGVYNTTGQLVLNGTTNNGSLSVSDIPSGLYILKISDKSGIGTKRFLKQ